MCGSSSQWWWRCSCDHNDGVTFEASHLIGLLPAQRIVEGNDPTTDIRLLPLTLILQHRSHHTYDRTAFHNLYNCKYTHYCEHHHILEDRITSTQYLCNFGVSREDPLPHPIPFICHRHQRRCLCKKIARCKGAHPCTSSSEQGGGKRVLEDFF